MQIELKLTQHAVDQLNTRYPGWTKEKLIEAANKNPSWQLGNEIHTYLGTGFDLYESTNKIYRKRFQRRHLFMVNKITEDEGALVVTVVFHTHASILKWVNNPNTKLFNNIIDNSDDFLQYNDNVKVKLQKDHDLFDIRKDIVWKYGNKEFTITVESIN